jgi:hypothetical protein
MLRNKFLFLYIINSDYVFVLFLLMHFLQNTEHRTYSWHVLREKNYTFNRNESMFAHDDGN